MRLDGGHAAWQPSIHYQKKERRAEKKTNQKVESVDLLPALKSCEGKKKKNIPKLDNDLSAKSKEIYHEKNPKHVAIGHVLPFSGCFIHSSQSHWSSKTHMNCLYHHRRFAQQAAQT